MVEGMLSLKKVLQSSDADILQSIPSVLDVAEAVVEIEARQDVLQQLCSQSIADHDIEELKAKNALTLSNIKAAEKEYMDAVTSGQFVEKIEKAVDALESLDEKEQKIEEEKSKVETLRAKNEAMAKSLAGFDQKSEEAKLEKLRQKRNELRKKLEKTKKLRADREFEYQQRLREVDSNAGGLDKRTDDGYSSENETPSMEQ
ncbi:unnamed protein product [Oikopleura dioica]|uniref:Uncharacterized protein n=1 Tax=Oikopleura dioica TaxID=34765 RepID=E4XEK6_OIKDI|nr:unnamed protein product [Oikopleura dioica]CBY31114.1 unnamed protein product [Oikopleura dioica]